jgi:deazaflavin-dependent oxidoreductase (nitroreductase family)
MLTSGGSTKPWPELLPKAHGRPLEQTRFKKPVDQTIYNRPNFVEHLFNKLFGFFVGLGLGLPHNYLLVVRGRKSGRSYSTPVNVLSYSGKRFLVAGCGYTQWVRNALASGDVVLRKGRQSERFTLVSVPDDAKPEILKVYLDRFRRAVQRYFPVPAGSPAAAFQPFASRYPVFELELKR